MAEGQVGGVKGVDHAVGPSGMKDENGVQKSGVPAPSRPVPPPPSSPLLADESGGERGLKKPEPAERVAPAMPPPFVKPVDKAPVGLKPPGDKQTEKKDIDPTPPLGALRASPKLDDRVKTPLAAQRPTPPPRGGDDGQGQDPESVTGRHRSVVVNILQEAGFTVTDKTMTYVDKAKLDKSKALESLKKLLKTRMEKTNDMDMMVLQDTMIKRIDSISFDKWAAKFGIVEGCAGSGKTTALIKCKEALGARAAIITHSSDQLARTFHGISGVYTPLDIMTREENFSEPHILLVDEYTKLHMCEIICCAAFLGSRSVFLFGDAKQGLSHGLGSEKHYSFSVIAKSNTCHRLPAKGRDFLNEVTGRDVQGGGNKEVGDVKRGDVYQEIPPGAVILAFTPASKKFLSRELGAVRLVSEVQGNTFTDVALFVFQRDLKTMQDPDLLEVALTRQRRKLVMCFESQELYARLVSGAINSMRKHSTTAQI